MKHYNLTVFETGSQFDLSSFYEEFSQVSDTEPLHSKLGKTYLFIFGTDVELLDLATFITSITHSLCTGYLLTEITSDVAAYLPLEKFEHLTLSTEGLVKQSNKSGKEKILAIMKPENLNRVYANVDKKTYNQQVEINYDLDFILDKIANSGINSLTSGERKFLDNFSA